MLTIAGVMTGDKSLTIQDIKSIAEAETFDLFLDGSQLDITQTAARRLPFPEVPFPGAEEGYSISYGVVVSPDALSVGSHKLAFEQTADGQVIDSGEITVFIDAAGTGACL